jgi:hypothetical protein
MDLTPYYTWIVFVHVLAAFAFVLVHGVSVVVLFRIRAERDRAKLGTLLEVSAGTLAPMYLAFATLFLVGILAGIVGGWWTNGRLWLWTALVIFVLLTVAMYVIPVPYFRQLRHALGVLTRDERRKGLPAPAPASDDELTMLLTSPRPVYAGTVSLVALALIIWLMVVKPF